MSRETRRRGAARDEALFAAERSRQAMIGRARAVLAEDATGPERYRALVVSAQGPAARAVARLRD